MTIDASTGTSTSSTASASEEVLKEVHRVYVHAKDSSSVSSLCDVKCIEHYLAALPSAAAVAPTEGENEGVQQRLVTAQHAHLLFSASSAGENTVVAVNGRLLPLATASVVVQADDLQLLFDIEVQESLRTSSAEQDETALRALLYLLDRETQLSFLAKSQWRFHCVATHRRRTSSSSAAATPSATPSAKQAKRVDVQGVLAPFAQQLPKESSVYYTFNNNNNENADVPQLPLSIVMILDPLTLSTLRGLPLLHLLAHSLGGTPVSLLLVPPLQPIAELPLPHFYRFVLDAETDDEEALDVARFTSLPLTHVLTTRLDTPETWNVQTFHALQDPDNLRCIVTSTSTTTSTTTSTMDKEVVCGDHHTDTSRLTYTLKSLLVAGQCLQATDHLSAQQQRFGLPPNGLQLLLAKEEVNGVRHIVWDTQVMQNLGYFQLQAATPGLYTLRLAPKAQALYVIDRPDEGVGEVEDEGQVVEVSSFSDAHRMLIVTQRPGTQALHRQRQLRQQQMQQQGGGGGLIDDDEDEEEDLPPVRTSSSTPSSSSTTSSTTASFWKSLFGSRHEEAVREVVVNEVGKEVVSEVGNEAEEDVIHVFSVATGALYERLLRIMMLSVSSTTSAKVHFWLLENYLSPHFKATAEVMARTFGYEVHYVSYKWPQWLRQQTQQQRIIWGYKILFLDVLFPAHVKKIIYVDADQVMRSDLRELRDLDLQNHVYAYTPFCASNPDTLGFQFWRQGYWKDHLGERPYHISALYVVDLVKFRRRKTGDTLRALYDQLSRDANSLSNLDQDLPNYAQHFVPIYSLPQQWLWCETWCDAASKQEAKTIDLCNNPLHKSESKLDMAKRIISGELFARSWVELDEEVKGVIASAGLQQAQ